MAGAASRSFKTSEVWQALNVTDEQTACAVSSSDRLVYELYGLTAEEIKIVEGKS